MQPLLFLILPCLTAAAVIENKKGEKHSRPGYCFSPF
jgi:hypothetical protein